MHLIAEAPTGSFFCALNDKLLGIRACPFRLKKEFGFRIHTLSHGFSEDQIVFSLDHHLQLMAAFQQLLLWWVVALG